MKRGFYSKSNYKPQRLKYSEDYRNEVRKGKQSPDDAIIDKNGTIAIFSEDGAIGLCVLQQRLDGSKHLEDFEL